MRVNKIEKRFDVLQGFAEELGIQYNGAQMAYAHRIRDHLIAEAKQVRDMFPDASAHSAVDTIIDRLKRLS